MLNAEKRKEQIGDAANDGGVERRWIFYNASRNSNNMILRKTFCLDNQLSLRFFQVNR